MMNVHSKIITTGSDFSGVGAFDYAMNRVCESKGIKHERIYACDWDKYARITYAHNHGEPGYFPHDVYDREIPKESLDVYMTSPPCQSFSLAGKRKGKDDERGILFFNSHEFIKINKPRFFIFENVKGLLSDDNGKTFGEWIRLLGGKSVNGLSVLFPDEDSVPYHLYWQVLNTKEHGIPQNRERVFLIGIRDNQDNIFQFPKKEHLTKKLKDVLEYDVDEKYFLSKEVSSKILIKKDHANYRHHLKGFEGYKDLSPTIKASEGSGNQILIKSATSNGYEKAEEGDSINLSVPNSKTRRGRVGKKVAQTLDTSCNQCTIIGYTRDSHGKIVKRKLKTVSQTIHTATGSGGNTDQFVFYNRIRRLTPRECFRLQDFPDSFDFSVVSDTQAYKQAGNSITVRVLEKILLKLKL
jgi:DNA (cytosine-5)-methyltransferase 1